jgi:hypothetical protein
MDHAMGASSEDDFRLDFDRRVRLITETKKWGILLRHFWGFLERHLQPDLLWLG